MSDRRNSGRTAHERSRYALRSLRRRGHRRRPLVNRCVIQVGPEVLLRADEGLCRGGIRKAAVSGGRDAVFGADILGEALGAFEAGGFGAGAETRNALGVEDAGVGISVSSLKILMSIMNFQKMKLMTQGVARRMMQQVLLLQRA